MAPIHFADQAQQILVTGGTGFIGQELIKALVADGHYVTVLTRNPRKAKQIFNHPQINCINQLTECTVPIDVIINLAGARILGIPWTEKRKMVLRQSRIGLTDKIIDWLKHTNAKPKLLLTASAIGYYGIQAQGDNSDLTENSPPQSIFMSQLVQEWEQANAQASQYGVKVAAMRFGLVLGKQGGALPMMLLPIKFGLGGKLGSGQQWTSWIHIRDLLRALAHVWQLTLKQNQGFIPYNFTAPHPVSQASFTATAAKILHRSAFIPTPAFVLKLALGEQADLLLEGQKVIPSALLNTHFRFDFPTLESALRDIIENKT